MTTLERLKQDLSLAGYARRTQDAYLAAVREFLASCPKAAARLNQDDLRRWVSRLVERRRSPQRLRQHFAALKFYFGKTLGRPAVTAFLSWPSERERLPVVLSPAEIAALLRALQSPKYRVFFTLVYATGLRLTEACRLETATSTRLGASSGSARPREDASAW
jgi:site-specific recombinase XerD